MAAVEAEDSPDSNWNETSIAFSELLVNILLVAARAKMERVVILDVPSFTWATDSFLGAQQSSTYRIQECYVASIQQQPTYSNMQSSLGEDLASRSIGSLLEVVNL